MSVRPRPAIVPRSFVAHLSCQHPAVEFDSDPPVGPPARRVPPPGPAGDDLDPGRQALLVLAHLRNGDTYTRLTAAFGIGVATVYRYIREALDLLAATAPTLNQAVYQAARLIYVILDGTLIPIDRVADQRPYYSGKHKRHGVNVRVLAGSRGQLLWASPALPGAVHDVRAARTHHIPAMLTKHGVAAYADNAYAAPDQPSRCRFDAVHDHSQPRNCGSMPPTPETEALANARWPPSKPGNS